MRLQNCGPLVPCRSPYLATARPQLDRLFQLQRPASLIFVMDRLEG